MKCELSFMINDKIIQKDMARLQIKEDKKVPFVRDHSVNLMAESQPRQLVRSCFVHVDRRWSILTHVPKDKYILEVSYDVPSSIVTNPHKPLFVVEYKGDHGRRLNIEADGHEAPFQLYFEPDNVLDCLVPETDGKDIYTIVCSVILKDSQEKTICKVDTDIALSFASMPVMAPKVVFEPNDRGCSLEYNVHDDKPFQIGHIVVSHSGIHMRCPSIDISLDVQAWADVEDGKAKGIDDLIFFAGKAEQTSPRIVAKEDTAGIVPIGLDGSDFTFRVERCNAILKHVMVNQKQPGSRTNDNEIRIPLYWDMTKSENPSSDHFEYKIHHSLLYMNSDKKSSYSKALYNDQVINLTRNRSIMDLKVNFGDGMKVETLTHGCKPARRVPDMMTGMTTAYTLELINTAEYVDPTKAGASIYIKGFSYDLPKAGILYKEMKGAVMETLFTYSDKGSSLLNGKDYKMPVKSILKLVMVYDHTCIYKILGSDGHEIYERLVYVPVKFDYYVDADDEYMTISDIPSSAFQPFEVKLPILIRKEAAPEWLCVDLGTSAVVASYGSMAFDENGQRVNSLINLKDVKAGRLRDWFPNDANFRHDDSESNGHLIASTSVVNMTTTKLDDSKVEASIKDVMAYRKAHIQFSPSSGMIDIYLRMLPSLKTLMGNKNLPKELLPANVALTGSLSIEKIFELIYKQFFNIFLPEYVINTNKLIMTVPNTYAPVHVDILRTIAKAALPKLRPDYLRFLSESDAVAFYYLLKRMEFIQNTDFNLPDGFDDNVLVYDMGAGTLDLTYYTRRQKGEKYEIDILGKMGVSRAGNYLDYLLAEIVVSLVESLPDLPATVNVVEMRKLLELKSYPGRHGGAASQLKKFVRDSLKPMLNCPVETKLPPLNLFNVAYPTTSLTIGQILSHDLFKAYLEEVSTGVFSHFASLFNTEEDPVRPELVIFSGRTTCLKVLRDAVASALSGFGVDQFGVLFLDLAGEKYSRDVSMNYENMSNLKTAVVDGAFAFCTDFASGHGSYSLRNKNLYAQYGIMFKVAGVGWVWEKLLDTHTKPIDDSEVEISGDGVMIYQYDSRIHDASEANGLGQFEGPRVRRRDFTGVTAAYVLQSYSSDTEADWPNNLDMISVIGHVDLTNVRDVKEYSLTIDEENNVHLKIGAGDMALLPHDGYSSESFKKSMWPIVR